MSITIRTSGGWGISTFPNASSNGPNLWSLPIDSRSTTSLLKLVFTFDGMAVEINFTGSFPDNPSSLGSLSAVGTSMVSGITYAINGQVKQTNTFSPEITVDDAIQIDRSTDFATLTRVFSGNDVFIGSVTPYGDTDDNDWIDGYAGNDTFYVNFANNSNYKNAPWSDGFYGNSGIDTAVFSGTRAEYTLGSVSSYSMNTHSGSGFSIHDSVTNRNGDTMVMTVERLQFTDKKVALDVTDNALETLQFIGVIAPSLQSNLNVRGTILSLFDQGKSMQEMSQLALDIGLITSDNTTLAKTVFKNVFNTQADPDQNLTNTLVRFIEQNGDAKFIATVAGLNINVDLVGLQQHGMEFI